MSAPWMMSRGGGEQSDFGKQGDRELYVENLRVYREWRFGSIGPYLTGLNHSVIWDGGGAWSSAMCLKGGYSVCEQIPSEDCTCGFYGWYQPGRTWGGGPSALFGVADVAGTARLGSLGLRAERMRPLALVVAPTPNHLTPQGCGCPLCRAKGAAVDTAMSAVRQAIDRYLPGVSAFTSIDALLEAFPPSDWESIVGHIPTLEEQRRAEDERMRAQMTDLALVMDRSTRMLMVELERSRWRAGINSRAVTNELQKLAPQPAAPLRQVGIVTSPVVPSGPMQRALDARKSRNTGPAWLRDPFRRKAR